MFKYLKKRFGHWMFRYIYNRFCALINELLYPDRPWLVKDAVKILDSLLKNNDIGLEFGSGRSTLWFVKRVKKLISIEHNKLWFNKIKNEFKKQNINNVNYYLKSENEYVNILDEINDNSLDFVLVDGLLRDVCVKKSLSKIKNGGLLIVDNINWFAPSNTYSPSSMKDNNFASDIWQDLFTKDIINWRRIWTSNGITDTLILFKS